MEKVIKAVFDEDGTIIAEMAEDLDEYTVVVCDLTIYKCPINMVYFKKLFTQVLPGSYVITYLKTEEASQSALRFLDFNDAIDIDCLHKGNSYQVSFTKNLE